MAAKSFKERLKGRRQSKNVVDNRLAGFAEKQHNFEFTAERKTPKGYSGQTFGKTDPKPSKGLFAPAGKVTQKFTKTKGKPSGVTPKGAIVPFGKKKSKLPKAQGQV